MASETNMNGTEDDIFDEHIFQGIKYYIDPTVPRQLASMIDRFLGQFGASHASEHSARAVSSGSEDSSFVPRFDLLTTTHIITNSTNIREYQELGRFEYGSGDVLVVEPGKYTDCEDASQSSARLLAPNSVETSTYEKRLIKLVTPLWVTHTFDMCKLLPTEFYSPASHRFFSGIVVAIDLEAEELPQADLEFIESAILSFGGQFKRCLTRDTTHFLYTGHSPSVQYQMAMTFKDQLDLQVVLPHWFHECFSLRTIVSTRPFEFPRPPILEPIQPTQAADHQHGIDGHPGSKIPYPLQPSDIETKSSSNFKTATRLAFHDQNLSPRPVSQGLNEYLSVLNSDFQYDEKFSKLVKKKYPPQIDKLDDNHDIRINENFKDKTVYLVSTLGISLPLRRNLISRIERLGAVVHDANEDDILTDVSVCQKERDRFKKQSEGVLRNADYVLCETRSGWEFWLSWKLRKTIGTVHWILTILNYSHSDQLAIRSPLDRLLDFPTPLGPVNDWDPDRNKVTLTNYTGISRTYLIRLIQKMGLSYCGALAQDTALVVAANQAGQKVDHATKTEIQVVNHLYLEDCFKAWKRLPILISHHTFPDGVNLVELIGQATQSFESIAEWARTPDARRDRKESLVDLPSEKLIHESERSSLSPRPTTPPLKVQKSTRSTDGENLDAEGCNIIPESHSVTPGIDLPTNVPDVPQMEIDEERIHLPTEARDLLKMNVDDERSLVDDPQQDPTSVGGCDTAEPDSGCKSSTGMVAKRRTRPRLISTPCDSTEDSGDDDMRTCPCSPQNGTERDLDPSDETNLDVTAGASRASQTEIGGDELPNASPAAVDNANRYSDDQHELASSLRKSREKSADRDMLACSSAPRVEIECDMLPELMPLDDDDFIPPEDHRTVSRKGSASPDATRVPPTEPVLNPLPDCDNITHSRPSKHPRSVSGVPKPAQGRQSKAGEVSSGCENHFSSNPSSPEHSGSQDHMDDTACHATHSKGPSSTPVNLSRSRTEPALSETNDTPKSRRTRTEPYDEQPDPLRTHLPDTRKRKPPRSTKKHEMISSQSARPPSTRRAAVNANAKVADAALDMNNHAKEKKRKRLSGGGIAGTDDGGYFGDVGSKPPSESAGKSRRGKNAASNQVQQNRPELKTLPSRPSRNPRLKDEDSDGDGDVDGHDLPPVLDMFPTANRKKKMPEFIVKKDFGSDASFESDVKSNKLKGNYPAPNLDEDSYSTTSVPRKPRKARSPVLDLADTRSAVRILQTGERIDDELKDKLGTLGAKFTETPKAFTHLMTNKIQRTTKFIMAVINGRHIVDHKWAEDCGRTGTLLDTAEYLLRDIDGERRHGFVLQEAIEAARISKILSNHIFYVSPNVEHREDTISLVKSAGGKVITTAPLVKNVRNHPNTHVVSCEDDVRFWKPLMKRRDGEEPIPIYNRELIMEGLLTQKMRYHDETYILPTDKADTL